MKYWNGYQWKYPSAETETLSPEMENMIRDSVVAKMNEKPHPLSLSQLLPRTTAEVFSCEVDPCDKIATHRVGDSVNVCADHIEAVIEDGDSVEMFA